MSFTNWFLSDAVTVTKFNDYQPGNGRDIGKTQRRLSEFGFCKRLLEEKVHHNSGVSGLKYLHRIQNKNTAQT